jgi:hypothetical protein
MGKSSIDLEFTRRARMEGISGASRSARVEENVRAVGFELLKDFFGQKDYAQEVTA